jgi:hypothetical protein
MPEAPKGERRPADVIGNAVHVMRIATGPIEDNVPSPEDEGKDPAAVALGRKGGKARVKYEQETTKRNCSESSSKTLVKIDPESRATRPRLGLRSLMLRLWVSALPIRCTSRATEFPNCTSV